LPRSYTHALKGALAATIQTQLEESEPFEALDLTEELLLVRNSAANAVAIYSQALDEGATLDVVMQAGLIMQGQLSAVADMCDKAAKVAQQRNAIAGAFTDTLARVISSVLHAAYEVWGNDHSVGEFEKLLRSKLKERKLPGAEGTALTPDLDVTEMDDTVPSGESEV
jgi:hypothetical protein